MTYTPENTKSIENFWIESIKEHYIDKEDIEFLPKAIKTYTAILLDFKIAGAYPVDYTTFARICNFGFIKGLLKTHAPEEEIMYRAERALSSNTKKLVQEYLEGLTVMAEHFKAQGSVAVYPGSIHAVYTRNADFMINDLAAYIDAVETQQNLQAQVPSAPIVPAPRAAHKI